MSGRGESAAWFVTDESTGDVVGTFWSPFTGESDFGYSSDLEIPPVFEWSPDRDYVAVEGGPAEERTVFLYRATGTTLKKIPLPELPESLEAAFAELGKARAAGFRVERWESGDELVLLRWERFASGRFAVSEVHVVFEKLSARIASATEPEGMKSLPEKTDDSAPTPAAFDPASLEGEHPVSGSNAQGTSYTGTVEIRVKNGLVLLKWQIGNKTTFGTGLVLSNVSGNVLGIAYDQGVAIYQIVSGKSGPALFGVWASQGMSSTGTEIIGNSAADPELPVFDFNGRYTLVTDDRPSVPFVIDGGDFNKEIRFGKERAEGLALGDGLAIITPQGLIVLQMSSGEGGFQTITGKSLDSQGNVQSVSLVQESD